MLERLQRVALWLAPMLWVALLGAIFCFAALVAHIFELAFTEFYYAIPLYVGLLASLTLYTFTLAFRRIPARPVEGDRFGSRLRARLLRFGYWILAIVLLGTTGAVVFLIIRLMNIWIGENHSA